MGDALEWYRRHICERAGHRHQTTEEEVGCLARHLGVSTTRDADWEALVYAAVTDGWFM